MAALPSARPPSILHLQEVAGLARAALHQAASRRFKVVLLPHSWCVRPPKRRGRAPCRKSVLLVGLRAQTPSGNTHSRLRSSDLLCVASEALCLLACGVVPLNIQSEVLVPRMGTGSLAQGSTILTDFIPVLLLTLRSRFSGCLNKVNQLTIIQVFFFTLLVCFPFLFYLLCV